MIYGYARVSSKAQLKGNSLEEQRTELERNGCEVIIEEQFSGKTTVRPKFEKLIKEQLGTGDTLIVTKLDRFARNVTEGISTIRYLFAKGVKVHVLNVGLLENTVGYHIKKTKSKKTNRKKQSKKTQLEPPRSMDIKTAKNGFH